MGFTGTPMTCGVEQAALFREGDEQIKAMAAFVDVVRQAQGKQPLLLQRAPGLTGSGVMLATMPGRCAAPPAPAEYGAEHGKGNFSDSIVTARNRVDLHLTVVRKPPRSRPEAWHCSPAMMAWMPRSCAVRAYSNMRSGVLPGGVGRWGTTSTQQAARLQKQDQLTQGANHSASSSFVVLFHHRAAAPAPPVCRHHGDLAGHAKLFKHLGGGLQRISVSGREGAVKEPLAAGAPTGAPGQGASLPCV